MEVKTTKKKKEKELNWCLTQPTSPGGRFFTVYGVHRLHLSLLCVLPFCMSIKSLSSQQLHLPQIFLRINSLLRTKIILAAIRLLSKKQYGVLLQLFVTGSISSAETRALKLKLKIRILCMRFARQKVLLSSWGGFLGPKFHVDCRWSPSCITVDTNIRLQLLTNKCTYITST